METESQKRPSKYLKSLYKIKSKSLETMEITESNQINI